jgi:hypothetical protein
MSWKKNHCIALTDKFSIVAAHHWLEYTSHTGLDIYKISSAATAGVGDLSAISHRCKKADEMGAAMANPGDAM